MRTPTAIAILVVLAAALVAAAFGLGFVGNPNDDLSLSSTWVSETGRDVDANHHAPAVGTVDGEPMVFAPVSGRRGTPECGLYAFSADGTREWSYQVAPANCTIHSVADPATADFDGDGELEVLTATTEQQAVALDAKSGNVERRIELSSYGYTRPVVADLVGDETPETVVVDALGTVSVFRPDGTTVWSRQLETYTWGQPAVVDADGDGTNELVVGIGGEGALLVYEGDGSLAWERRTDLPGGVTWMATGQGDADVATEIATGTSDGAVVLVDGTNGSIEWQHDFGRFAAVHAFGDGDLDGTTEVYATARDGTLRAIDAPTGTIEWTTQLTTSEAQMMPPPALGDVDGDGAPDLVTVTNDGVVAVVNPETGDVRTQYDRETPIFTHPTLADLDGDGAREILVMYGDGRVVVLDAAS